MYDTRELSPVFVFFGFFEHNHMCTIFIELVTNGYANGISPVYITYFGSALSQCVDSVICLSTLFVVPVLHFARSQIYDNR